MAAYQAMIVEEPPRRMRDLRTGSGADIPDLSDSFSREVSAIIPAYNEADVIADTVRAALAIPWVSEVVVVDDGSEDNTAQVARSAGAHEVVSLERNLGKGEALNRALQCAVYDTLLLLDADLGSSASEGSELLIPVLSGSADMTVAIFDPLSEDLVNTGEGDLRLAARSGGFGLVVKTARLGIWLLTRNWMKSPLAGPRALRREIVDNAGGFSPGFGVEVGLTVDALRMGYRVAEVPVRMVHRPSGRDLRGFAHRGRQMGDMLLTLGMKVLRI